MSIEINWELTEAPRGDDETSAAQLPPAPLPPGPPPSPPPAEEPPAPRRRRWWLAVPVALLVVAGLALYGIGRLGWQRLTEEVVALVRYEEKLSQQGETLLVLRVQDYTDSQWLSVRINQVAAHQPAPLPMPVLSPDLSAAEIGPLAMVANDWVRAEVVRQYQAPNGETLTFSLPQFYRRPGLGQDWVRTGVPDAYWGSWRDWQSPHLFIRHSDRDAALVARMGPALEALLAEACLVWGNTCAELPQAKLFLSGYVGSLEYNPLDNVRVRVEFGSPTSDATLPTDYFLSVPSPQLAGLPADAAAEQYLTDYLAVRLIASLADTATATDAEASALTAQAVARLNLHNADPGFAAATTPPRGDSSAEYVLTFSPPETPAEATPTTEAPTFGATLVTRQRPTITLLTYEVQPGDALWAIAANYGVSVESLASLNGLADPNLIQPGTKLLIPREPVFPGEPSP